MNISEGAIKKESFYVIQYTPGFGLGPTYHSTDTYSAATGQFYSTAKTPGEAIAYSTLGDAMDRWAKNKISRSSYAIVRVDSEIVPGKTTRRLLVGAPGSTTEKVQWALRGEGGWLRVSSRASAFLGGTLNETPLFDSPEQAISNLVSILSDWFFGVCETRIGTTYGFAPVAVIEETSDSFTRDTLTVLQ